MKQLMRMSRKVHPEKNANNSQISSTSRHQLRENKLYQGEEGLQASQFNLSNLKLKFFVARLAKKIKYLSPPWNKPVSVVEEWEQELRNEEEMLEKKKPDIFRKETLTEQITTRYQPVHIFSVVQGILIILFSWTVTVSLVFQEIVLLPVPLLIIVICLWELAMKTKIGWDQRQESKIYEIQWTSDFMEPFLLLVAAVLMLVRAATDWGVVEWVVLPFQLIVVYIEWQKTGRYFDYIKIYAEQNKKRKELRIIELFGFTLVMAHIFALIMYSMTYICPDQSTTWVGKAGLTGQPWYVIYIYSYYWANTTMVTVGYGDLTPNNPYEIVIVTMIQIVGTAIFGYMINVIGITVNEIQKKNQEFEEHESTIVKLRDHYGLSRQLCYKMKSDIKKKESEMTAAPLNSNEERVFLGYIDETLKDEFVLETNIRVIKKSIFFLTHFTVHFQNQIALKLIRHIYKPQEIILSKDQQQRQLVIIHSGQVNLHYVKKHHNQTLLKLGRIIKPEEGKPTLNVYGYSSVIMDKDVGLRAVTEQTTTAYILKRTDILECMRKNILDFQSFNELREKMQQSVKFQEIEAPALKDQQHHFIPNSYLIVKKAKHKKQGRGKGNRGNRRVKMYVITLQHYQNKTILYIPEENKETEEFDIEVMLQVEKQNQAGNKNKVDLEASAYLEIDQAKTFEHFLKKFNLPTIAKQYEAACAKRSSADRERELSRKLNHHFMMREARTQQF